MSIDMCFVVHDDLRCKNQTTVYNCRFSAVSLALQVIFIHQKTSADICVVHDDLQWITEQHIVIGFGELAAVD